MKLNFITIFLALVYAINVYAQADKTIPNRALNGDIKLQVNDGGVPTDALTIDGATGNMSLSGSLSSPTITGDMTVDSPTLHVDSSNNRVGVGTITPGSPLHVQQSEANSNDDGIILDASGEGSARIYLQGGQLKFAKSSIDALAITNSQVINLAAAKRGFNVSSNDAIISNGAAMGVQTIGFNAPGVTGLIWVESARTSGAQNSTGTLSFFNSRGSQTPLNLATQSLGSGCTHTVTIDSNNQVIVTNTSGVQCAVNAAVIWLTGY